MWQRRPRSLEKVSYVKWSLVELWRLALRVFVLMVDRQTSFVFYLVWTYFPGRKGVSFVIRKHPLEWQNLNAEADTRTFQIATEYFNLTSANTGKIASTPK